MKKNIIIIFLVIILNYQSVMAIAFNEIDNQFMEEVKKELASGKKISFERYEEWGKNIVRMPIQYLLCDLFDSTAPVSQDEALFFALAISKGKSEQLYSNLKSFEKNSQFFIEEINKCRKVHKKYPDLSPSGIFDKIRSDMIVSGVLKMMIFGGSYFFITSTLQATQPIWGPFIQNVIRKFMFKNSIQPSNVSVLFKQIYGYEDIKKRLRVIVKGLKKQKKSQNLEKIDGVLFYGDPGCGKTYVAQAIGHEADVPFFAIKVSDLLNDKGVVEDRIRLVFNKISGYVLNHKVPVILFIDEVDLLIPTRAQGKLSPEERLILQDFLSLLDGQIPLEGVLVIANTNYIKDIDVALLRRGRIGTHIEFKLPSQEDILILIKNFAKGFGITIDEAFDMQSFAALFNGKNVATIKSSIALLKDYMIENNKKLILTNELLASYMATFALY
jgi:AAA+ superfamily predicted ATPase